MKLMTKHQEESIIELYNQGLSALKVSKKLTLSLHQVYGALTRNEIPRRSSMERFQLIEPTFSFQDDADLKLLVAGTMLYFGEGAKTGATVDLANSDPKILKVFISYLRNIFQIDERKIRLYLYCFSDQNINELKKFWAEELKVGIENFTKPYVRLAAPSRGRIMPWGLLHIRYNDKRLLEKILSLCSDLSAELTAN